MLPAPLDQTAPSLFVAIPQRWLAIPRTLSLFPVPPNMLLFFITPKLYQMLSSVQSSPLPYSKADPEPDPIYSLTLSFTV